MASHLVITLSLISYLFLFTSSSSSASRIILPSDSQKVSVGLYYESLCPYSANFIINYLDKLFETDLISIVDLKLVPWGNAKLRGNNTFDCQVMVFLDSSILWIVCLPLYFFFFKLFFVWLIAIQLLGTVYLYYLTIFPYGLDLFTCINWERQNCTFHSSFVLVGMY